MATKTANTKEVQKSLSGINYPAQKQDIIDQAKSRGAVMEVVEALSAIPEREYQNSADVSSELDSKNSSMDDSEDEGGSDDGSP